jgi:ABC-type sugar transport system permease subunit
MSLRSASSSASMIQEQVPWYRRIQRWYRHHRDAVIAWSFLTPMIIYFLVMTLVPLFFLIAISFTEWNIISPPKWVGFRNIQKIFSSYDNWFYLKIIGRTFVYSICILALNIAGGFFIALVLNQENLRFKGLFRTMWYLPSVFSGAVIAMLLKIYLNASTAGVLNMVLAKFHIAPVAWLQSNFWTPLITVVSSSWLGCKE